MVLIKGDKNPGHSEHFCFAFWNIAMRVTNGSTRCHILLSPISHLHCAWKTEYLAFRHQFVASRQEKNLKNSRWTWSFFFWNKIGFVQTSKKTNSFAAFIETLWWSLFSASLGPLSYLYDLDNTHALPVGFSKTLCKRVFLWPKEVELTLQSTSNVLQYFFWASKNPSFFFSQGWRQNLKVSSWTSTLLAEKSESFAYSWWSPFWKELGQLSPAVSWNF